MHKDVRIDVLHLRDVIHLRIGMRGDMINLLMQRGRRGGAVVVYMHAYDINVYMMTYTLIRLDKYTQAPLSGTARYLAGLYDMCQQVEIFKSRFPIHFCI